MAIRKIVKMGNPLLREVSATLTDSEITSKETQDLIKDLMDTMEENDGIGIAAPQIGVLKQLAIVGVMQESETDDEENESDLHIDYRVVINPEITILEEELLGSWAGCLSVPGMRGYVQRPRKISVKYKNEKAETIEYVAEGFPSIVFQHEIDHLFGKLYVDRIEDIRNFGYSEEYEDMEEAEA